jgi:DNA-binding LytR/AlgR family response regulator
MNVLIAEDEAPAADRLKLLLNRANPALNVCACFDSVQDTVSYLRTESLPGLLILDIHLSDGQSFDIFRQVDYNGPVIFTTAYDHYVMDAFKVMSIDYILKPVSFESLAAAIAKLEKFTENYFPSRYNQLGSLEPELSYKTKFLVKKGQRLLFAEAKDIVYFQAVNKVVYLTDRSGVHYIVNYSLDRIEGMLDPAQFFRVNRSMIVNISFVAHLKPYTNSRLEVFFKTSSPAERVIVSRERVSQFKEWFG